MHVLELTHVCTYTHVHTCSWSHKHTLTYTHTALRSAPQQAFLLPRKRLSEQPLHHPQRGAGGALSTLGARLLMAANSLL